MPSLSPLRTAAQPLARAVVARAARLETRPRHPLAPAAVRVERSRSRRGGEVAEQTAVTLWFGAGPDLPGPATSRSPWRVAAGVGMTLVGAAAFAAASTVAAHRDQTRRLRPPLELAALPAAPEVPAAP
jgi:hypothetical protein